jgi:mono/diheme cytochrome c family protein
MFQGLAPALTTLADTRHFLLWSLAAALLLGIIFLLLRPRWARPVPLVLIMVTGFAFFGGYERLREGVRKPFLIHDYMYSNGLKVEHIDRINEEGLLAVSGWVARAPADDPVERGRQIFRIQCASCHTVSGYQGIRELLPDDPDMALGVIFMMYEQGLAYSEAGRANPVDKSGLDYPYMPPFVGTDEEMEALASYLAELSAGEDRPSTEGGAR